MSAVVIYEDDSSHADAMDETPVADGDLVPLQDLVQHRSFMYVWGQCGNDQLGLKGPEEGCLFTPAILPAMTDILVKQVAIGSMHSLILTDHGVYSCGNNEHGQLGHDKLTKNPELVTSLEQLTVTGVAVGDKFSVALCEDGKLYTWGDNTKGQLGHQNDQNKLLRCIEFTSKAYISQVACGESHCLALAREGSIYVWGCNQNGQLGLGSLDRTVVREPAAIQSIRSLHFTHISAGGNHSFALTASGALFGWGNNSNGQLGLGTDSDKLFPVCCRSLRNLHVKYVTCGVNHTAVLTQDGGVFTFGAGNVGQLGHNSYTSEKTPKKILELMGSTVTQIACGRNHTMAYVPASGRVYTFGLGAFGQLGLSNTEKQCSPCHVPGMWCNGVRTLIKPLYIAAGGNSSLVYCVEQSIARISIDQRNLVDLQMVMNEALIDLLLEHSNSAIPGLRLPTDLEYTLECVFSNASAWNGAFLKSELAHYGCSSTNHGIDMDTAKEALSRLGKCTNVIINQLIASSVEQKLLPSLTQSIPDVEALRMFLVVPFLSLFTDPSNYAAIHAPYGNAVLSLSKTATNVFDRWLKLLPSRHFKYYLTIFKKSLVHILSLDRPTTDYEVLVRQTGMFTSLKMMHKLYNINEETGEQLVSCYEFYVPEIVKKVDIEADYINWYRKSHEAQPAPFSFCNHPFVLDAQAKAVLLHTDAKVQMQLAIDEAHRRNLFNILCSPTIDPVHPCLVLTVSRDDLLNDTLVQLRQHSSADLKKPLKVKFKDEEAEDAGGVRKEFFLLLLKEVLDPKYGMFEHHEETRMLWFNATSFEDSNVYLLVGLLCGLAIYNATIIYLPFPLALYKKILKRPVNLDDLREIEPQIAKSLQDLLDYDGEDVENTFCLNFTVTAEVYGYNQTQLLIPNGQEISVTNQNRQHYVDCYIDYFYNQSVSRMFEAFKEGFLKVCGSKVLNFFHPTELQAMVIGNEEYDWDELEKHCEYKGEYYRQHPTVQLFWNVFHKLTLQEKKKFLMFLTGCDRIPIQGMKDVKMYMQPCGAGEDFLPVAHTCFNLLDLPKYTSKEKLREKLLIAIDNTQGFGLV